jgi:hypothetical protein
MIPGVGHMVKYSNLEHEREMNIGSDTIRPGSSVTVRWEARARSPRSRVVA